MTMHSVRIYDEADPSNPIYLTSAYIFLGAPFVPRSPDISEEEAVDQTADGGEVINATRRNVTETIEILLTGTTTDNCRALGRSLEVKLVGAEYYQRWKMGGRKFLEVQWGASGDWYRSEILTGKVEYGEEATRLGWMALALPAALIVKRRFYWEASTEVEVALAVKGAAKATGGVAIYNHADTGATHGNWVHIAAADVAGVLPAPCRIELTNTYNTADHAYTVRIGQNIFSVPGSLSHVLEGESCDYSYGSAGVPVDDDDASGAHHEAITWNVTTEQLLIGWTLGTTLLSYCRGNYFRLLARLIAVVGNERITPKITYGASHTSIAEAPEVLLDDSYTLQDLGVLQIPPWLPGDASSGAVDLMFYGHAPGSPNNLYVDYVQLTPLDRYRVLTPRSYGLPYGLRLMDDGMAGTVYTDNGAGAGKAGHYVGTGNLISLWPGKDQRLYFLTSNDTGGCEILRTAVVRIYYRPRRLTL